MGISHRMLRFLREMGHETIHPYERGLERLSDADILAMARDDGYVLLTHDLDFSELVAKSGARLPSVITFRLRSMRPGNVNQHLYALLDNMAKGCSAASWSL
jgi:predicted nuclease of predicted toxin-antitoxin system